MSSLVLQGTAGIVTLPRGTTRLAIPNVLLNNNCTVVGNTFKLLDAGQYLLDIALQLTAFGSDLAYTLELFNETDSVVVASNASGVSPVSAPVQQQFQFAFTADPTKFYSIRFKAPVGANPNVGQIVNNAAAQIVITSLTSSGNGGSSLPSNGAVRLVDGVPINNSIVFVLDALLKFSIGANETWQFEFFVAWDSPTAELAFEFSGPAAPSNVVILVDYGQITDGPNFVNAFLTPMYISNGVGPFVGHGIVQNGVNAGVVQMAFAQKVAVVEDTVVQKGSYLIATRLA